MGIIKGFTFDGVNSSDYNIGITGSAVYNAPTRDVEMISIPGRDGAYALDHGRFNNIEITYPSGMGDNDQTNFAQRVSDLRNQLASRVGYKRLEDEYNPDEYRMAIYKSGLEVSPTQYSRAGQFDITFDCKPQRFLKSGETQRAIDEWSATETKSGGLVHFEGLPYNIKTLNVDVDVVQSGYGTPSLTNVRNFEGTSTVYINKAKKNLLYRSGSTLPYTLNGITYTLGDDNNTIIANGTATANSSCQVGYRFQVRENYILTGCPQGGSSTTYELQVTDGGRAIHEYGNGVTLTPNPNGKWENIYIVIRAGQSVENLAFKPMIRLPNTNPSYEPFNGLYYTKALDTPLYKGTVDYISGQITVTHKILDMNFAGRTSTNVSGKYGFYSSVVTGIKKPLNEEVPDMYCNRLEVTSRYDNYRATEGIAIHPSEGRLYVYIPDIATMTLADAQTWLESNPIQVVYPLETPEVIQTTARTMNLFEGVTNIYSRNGYIEVEYGQKPGTVINPTLFDAHPLISFNASGNGTISIGTQKIEFFNSPLGTIDLPFTVSTTEASADTSDYIEFSGSYNTGDKIRVKGSKATFNLTASSTINSVSFPSGMDLRVRPNESSYSGTNALTTVEDWQETEFTIGTASTVNKTYTPSYVYGGSSHTATFTLSLIYDGNTSIRMKWTATLPSGMTKNRITTSSSYTLVCDSTANSLTGDLYIDLDIGEAYKINNGDVVSINNFVNLGGELPTLPPGNTTITYSNTISNFMITPRWWKI